MKKILKVTAILLTLLASKTIYAEKIIALVNKKPILESEFNSQKRLLLAITPQLSTVPGSILDKKVLEYLIEQQITIDNAKEFGISVSDKDVIERINLIEKSNNVGVGTFISQFNSINLLNEFKNYIKSQIEWQNLVVYLLSSEIRVGENELISQLENKNLILDVQEFKILGAGEENYKVMKDLLKNLNKNKNFNLKNIRLKNVNLVAENYASSPKATKTIEFKQFNAGQESSKENLDIIKSLPIGEFSSIVNTKDGYSIFRITNRDTNLNEENKQQVKNFILNKKLQLESMKLKDNLRKKANVQIMR